MDTPLISQACHVRKPAKPKRGRISKYAEVWDEFSNSIREFHVNVHSRLIDEVCTYVKKSNNAQDICTATLRLGSNISDQSGIFTRLASQLGETTKLVCRLSPIDCISLTTILQKLFHEVIDTLNLEDAPRLKKSLVTFENLVQIFKFVEKKQSEKQRSPKKRRETTSFVDGMKLVVILEDVTSVKPAILEDLCLILKSHLENMRTCLIFGMSSTSQSIHKILSFKCSSCLSIQTFTSPPVPETLAGIFNMLILNRDFPLRISAEVFNWLSDFVLYHDFSLNTLLHVLQVALTLHLRTVDQKLLENLLNEEPESELPGWNEHLLADAQMEELSKALVCLEDSKSVTFKNCYLALQGENFLESTIFKKCKQTVKFLSTDELLGRLQTFVEIEQDGDLALEFVTYCERLMMEDLQENLAEKDDTNLSNVESRFELKDKLRLAIKKKRTTKLDIVKEDLIRYLEDRVKSIARPSTLPSYEELYIKNVAELSDLFAPALRSRVNQALSTPSSYLKCKCCRVKSTELKADLPPISIAYKLHLECGKMINVYDWLQSYQVVKNDESKTSLAQFLRAVRELQILGYVKPTTRKTDHCQRLTWGSC